MNTSIGFENEEKLCQSINNKMFNDLNPNLRYFLFYLFPMMDKSVKFNCYQTENFIKPDICISQRNELRYVSVKYGQSETVHNEQLISFTKFLKDNGISDESIKTYLLYHYGDGTTDGTGSKRINSVAVRFMYDDEIRKMNQEFNQSKTFLKKFAARVLFDGVNPDASKADYIYYGDPDNGVFVSRAILMRHLEKKNWDYMTTCVHIGPFVLRPHARYVNKEILNEEHRHVVSINYPRFQEDLMYMAKRFNESYSVTPK